MIRTDKSREPEAMNEANDGQVEDGIYYADGEFYAVNQGRPENVPGVYDIQEGFVDHYGEDVRCDILNSDDEDRRALMAPDARRGFRAILQVAVVLCDSREWRTVNVVFAKNEKVCKAHAYAFVSGVVHPNRFLAAES